MAVGKGRSQHPDAGAHVTHVYVHGTVTGSRIEALGMAWNVPQFRSRIREITLTADGTGVVLHLGDGRTRLLDESDAL